MPWSSNFNLGLTTDQRHALSASLNGFGYVEYGTGAYICNLTPGLDLRAGSRAHFSVGPSFFYFLDRWHYFGQTPDASSVTHYLFGRLHFTQVSLTARADYTFTPTLSLQFYAQPFLSGSRYTVFLEPDDRASDDFGKRFKVVTPTVASDGTLIVNDSTPSRYTFANPDGNFRAFNSTTVLRWEYHPGSTIFLVWSQGRQSFIGDGSFSFTRDWRRLWQSDATNIFLVKISYWFNP